MIKPLTQANGRTNVPLRQLVHAMDSATTAAMIDQVDLGQFQANTRWSRDNAVTLAALAMSAFAAPSDQQQAMSRQQAVRSFLTLDSEDNAALGIPEPDVGTNLSLIETDDAAIVAVSGASTPWPANWNKENHLELKDWACALRAFPTQNWAQDARVHSGFKAQADAIWGQLGPLLQTALETQKAIHFTGHSMGASVALMLADRLQHETGQLPTSVLLLGGPEVGWSEHKAHLEKTGLAERIVNVTNSGDFVPHVLPGGERAGRQLFLDGHGRLRPSQGAELRDRFCTKLHDFFTGRGFFPMYRHLPIFYVAGLADPKNAGAF